MRTHTRTWKEVYRFAARVPSHIYASFSRSFSLFVFYVCVSLLHGIRRTRVCITRLLSPLSLFFVCVCMCVGGTYYFQHRRLFYTVLQASGCLYKDRVFACVRGKQTETLKKLAIKIGVYNIYPIRATRYSIIFFFFLFCFV